MRLGGRKQKIKSREEILHPAPPGQFGGAYKPLLESEIKKIIATAMRLLGELGMGEVPPILLQRALEKGAFVNSHGRLCFSQNFVEDIIDKAAKQFVFYGRNPSHSFELGGDKVHFGTGGAAVQVLDLETGLYRPSTLKDLYDFTRLADTLENISWFTRCCIATDIEDVFDLDVNTAFVLLKGTQKPVGMSFTLAEHVAPIIEMFDLALGGVGKFSRTPFCKAHISPVISPMRFGEDAVAVALECIKFGVPISNITAAQSGATAPASPAGFLAQSFAETLASLIMVNIFSPGYPMIFSNWPLVIDLRTGAFSGGGGEISLMNAASAQISNYLQLPSGVACSMSDAKAVDAQMGSEKAMSALAAGLAGGNLIYESAGMTASLLGASFESFVLDNEMLSHINMAIKGIDVNDETLGFEDICRSVLGDGHFLGGDATLQAMSRDYFYPSLADRNDPKTWAENGALDAWEVARERVREILGADFSGYLGAEAERAIRGRFRVML